MKRPAASHILQNMLPLCISILKLLKRAPKSLLSFMRVDNGPTQKVILSPNLLFGWPLKCGASLETDSFRWAPAAAALDDVVGPAAGSIKLMMKRVTVMAVGSCGVRADAMTNSFRVYHHVLHTIPDEELYDRSDGGDDGSATSSDQEFYTAPSTATFNSEEELGGGSRPPVMSDDHHHHHHHEQQLLHVGRILEAEQVQVQEQEEEEGGVGRRHLHQYAAFCPDIRIREELAAATLAKYSCEPWADFVGSMTEMIVAYGLTESGDLQALLRCYLRLNAAATHPAITLAFVTVLDELGLSI